MSVIFLFALSRAVGGPPSVCAGVPAHGVKGSLRQTLKELSLWCVISGTASEVKPVPQPRSDAWYYCEPGAVNSPLFAYLGGAPWDEGPVPYIQVRGVQAELFGGRADTQ